MSHLVKTVNAAGYAGTRPQAYKAQHPTNDPGQGPWLRTGPGGDVLLAVGTDHGDRPVSEAGAGHVLHLGHYLHRGLHGLGGRGSTWATSLLR